MPRQRDREKAKKSWRGMESLEARRLLSATATTPLGDLTIQPGASQTIDLSPHFNDPAVTGTPTVDGTTVLMSTTNGNIPLELLDATAPQTVSNFLKYMDAGLYNGTIFHRSVKGFVDQGGGFLPDGTAVPTYAAVQNEFHVSNTRGTVAMAKVAGDPNSATNQFFINEADNGGTSPNGLDFQNGGFTVFARVLGNGMQTADAINSLPIIDASSQIPNNSADFTQLPVQNASQPVSASNEVVMTSVTRVLSFSAVSDMPGLVAASVSGNNLTLAPAAGAAGIAHVTVTATDGSGGTAAETFAVDVTSTTNVMIGASAGKSVTYTDADGTTATIRLIGPGTATVRFSGNNLAQTGKAARGYSITGTSASLAGIDITGASAASTLLITTRGGTRQINLGPVTSDSSLKAILAKGANLTGGLSANGSIGSIDVASAQGGTISAASIGSISSRGAFADNLNVSSPSVGLTRFTAGSITGGSWSVPAIKSLVSGAVTNWSPTITGSAQSLTLKGAVNGSTITTGALGNVNVKGPLNGDNVQLTSASGTDLNRLNVSGAIVNSLINSAASIGTIGATSLTGSHVYAGIGNFVVNQVLANFPTDFVSTASIKSVRLTNSFTNSDIAAHDLNTLSLGSIATNNNGQPEGVSAATIKSLTGKANGKRVTLKNVTADNVQTELTKLNADFADFLVKLF